ncbi:hypothetical protein GGX14DRAFT_567437 [Mycena pura]|uniref:Uncharacterized protein n=1 Tax=Mycena pura TaxID=153505 RepID=A0AAD6VAY1_9AGAR|nr:hypothetical protein GGX14DRAFT_567437 [Mycena pura]
MFNDKVFEVLPTGWTRVEASEVSTGELHCLKMEVQLIQAKDDEPWKWRCSQENYVWTHLKNVISPDESWDFITELEFMFFIHSRWDAWTLQGTFMADLPPDDVYLFLFRPQVVLVDDKFTITTPPDSEKYYWAFDLAGFDRLTQQTAEDIGLPRLEFSLCLSDPRDRWRDDEIIGQFHAAKGFDPDGQDVAIARGYPLVGIKDTSRSSQEPTCDRSTNCGGHEAEDGIYYSLGLC